MIPVRPMKLRVERITDETESCAFSDPAAEVNARLATAGTSDFRLLGPLEVDLAYSRTGDEIYFHGRAAASGEGTCVRCLEPYPIELQVPCEFVLTPAVEDDSALELHAEDLSLSVYSGDEIDLRPLVEEQLILALPTRALCRDDCLGLCPTCGANRNVDPCACQPVPADPRLAVIRDLKVGRAT